MGRRTLQFTQWTAANIADTTNLTDGAHLTVTATSTTTGAMVWEIYCAGQETSTKIAIMQFARNSQLGSGTLGLSTGATDGPVKSFGGALAGVAAYTTAATNKPQRASSNAKARLNLTLNAFGGIVRWFANPGEEWGIMGTATSDSETSLSNAAAGTSALLGSHIVYEVI